MSFVSARALACFWMAAKNRLDAAKKEEKRWRDLIEAELFGAADLGINRCSIDAAQDFKFTRKQSIGFKYDAAKMTQLYKDVTPDQAELLSKVFVWEMDMKNAAYTALPDALRAIVDNTGMVEIKDAAPTLEIGSAKAEE